VKAILDVRIRPPRHLVRNLGPLVPHLPVQPLQDKKRVSLLLSICYVCPEPVLANVRFFSTEYKMAQKRRFLTSSSASSAALQGAFEMVGSRCLYQKTRLLLRFPYVCPEPVLVK
jgi:hypothetical protein